MFCKLILFVMFALMFEQPAKKKARRQARQEKAAKMAPRPTQLLRPAVHCPTIKVTMSYPLPL